MISYPMERRSKRKESVRSVGVPGSRRASGDVTTKSQTTTRHLSHSLTTGGAMTALQLDTCLGVEHRPSTTGSAPQIAVGVRGSVLALHSCASHLPCRHSFPCLPRRPLGLLLCLATETFVRLTCCPCLKPLGAGPCSAIEHVCRWHGCGTAVSGARLCCRRRNLRAVILDPRPANR